MRKVAVLPLLLFAFLLLGTSLAETPLPRTLYISLGACEDGGEMPADAVMWQRIGSKYYLFLPGSADLTEARVWYGGGGEISLNGQSLHNGDKTTGLKDGETARFRFQGRTYQVNVMQGSKIPALFINTASGNMTQINKTKTYKEAADLLMLNDDSSVEYDGKLDYIKMRGHTSALFNKKSYTIKLSRKTDLLNMGKSKKWVLTSNARDHALIRNQICFGLSEFVGLPYTPECRQVDLYLNHQYNGTYILQEKVEIGENRIDIRDLEKETEAVNEKELSEYPAAGSKKSEPTSSFQISSLSI